jgi:hypothetical protein
VGDLPPAAGPQRRRSAAGIAMHGRVGTVTMPSGSRRGHNHVRAGGQGQPVTVTPAQRADDRGRRPGPRRPDREDIA